MGSSRFRILIADDEMGVPFSSVSVMFGISGVRIINCFPLIFNI